MSGEKKEVFLNNFLSTLEEECKLRDSRVFRLNEMSPWQENCPLHLEVGVKLQGDSEVKLPFVVSSRNWKEQNVSAIVSGILMTVDRYYWGLKGGA